MPTLCGCCPLAQGKKGEEEAEVVVEKITSVFVPSIEASVHEFVAKWQDRDETDNFFQKCDGHQWNGQAANSVCV